MAPGHHQPGGDRRHRRRRGGGLGRRLPRPTEPPRLRPVRGWGEQQQQQVDTEAYATLDLEAPPPRSADVADSCAQTCLKSLSVLRKFGLGRQHLTRSTKRILAANSEEIHVVGAIFLKLSGRSASQRQVVTSAMVYVTDATDRFYLSRTVLSQLAVLGADFPTVGNAVATASSQLQGAVIDTDDIPACRTAPDVSATGMTGTPHTGPAKLATCGCPQRSGTRGGPRSSRSPHVRERRPNEGVAACTVRGIDLKRLPSPARPPCLGHQWNSEWTPTSHLS